VSFQSRDEPGRYLRRSSSRLWSDINELADPLLGDDLRTKSLRPIDSPAQRAQCSGDQVLFPEATDVSSNLATWWIGAG
jgi:hypothetical protein